jgi:hypothetical protein
LANETNTRKKVENALADAHRVIADKEALLQDARVTTTQYQNAHMDTARDRDALQATLTQTQQALDTETAARVDLQTHVNQLREKLSFEQQLHEKVIWKHQIFPILFSLFYISDIECWWWGIVQWENNLKQNKDIKN